MIDFDTIENEHFTINPKIKVIGIGGGGSNMVNSMIDAGYNDIDFVVANTDAQALRTSRAPHKIQLGVKLTKGLGAGANPDVGRRAAEEDIDRILDIVDDADIVFLTAGLGGGTGSGAMPFIARALKKRDILTIAVVTKPFAFEGKRRARVAQEALDNIKRDIDTVVVVSNQKLVDVSDQNVSLVSAFAMVNNIMNQLIRSVSDVITKPGYINVDFADVKAIMKQKGFAIIGTGNASGEDRARRASLAALESPLLENIDITGAKGILINICGDSTMSLFELNSAASVVFEKAHEDASIIMGSTIDDSAQDNISVTVIATGFTQSYISSQPVNQTTYESQDLRSVHYRKPSYNNKSVDIQDFDIPAIIRKASQEKPI